MNDAKTRIRDLERQLEEQRAKLRAWCNRPASEAELRLDAAVERFQAKTREIRGDQQS